MSDKLEPAVAVQKAYVFVRWLMPQVEKLPRSYKFTLGERLSSSGLDMLLALVEAAYATRKKGLLDKASHHVNAQRYLLRLAKDLAVLPTKSYDFAAGELDELGRMVGGWRKHVARQA